jgi:FHS family L-fucose permease-like MFS transporter
MSVPAGKIIARVGYKKGLALALGIMAFGLGLFVPAANVVSFEFFLFALFITATGISVLQVALNPYITALGSPETASSRMNLGGALNSFATFIGPIIGGAFILDSCLKENFDLTIPAEKLLFLEASAGAVKIPYIGLVVVTLIIAGILWKMNLPKLSVETTEEVQGSVWKYKHVRGGVFSIFFYVGAEVAIGSLLILYLAEEEMGSIPEKLGAGFLAFYWGSAMIGRFAGSFLTKKISSEKMLVIVTAAASVLIVVSLMPFAMNLWVDVPVIQMGVRDCASGAFDIWFPSIHIPLAGVLIMLIGLMNSVMWPSIFPLGIRKLGKLTSKGSGLMVMMIFGGAVIPLFQSFIAQGWNITNGTVTELDDHKLWGFEGYGFHVSFFLVLICYGYLFYYGLKGHKISDEDAKELEQYA